MARTTVTKRGQVTIPREIRERLQLCTGQVLLVEETDAGILLRTWDAEHDANDWRYHSQFARRRLPDAVYYSPEDFEQALRRAAAEAAQVASLDQASG